jgi:hypothetical protein
MSGRRATIRVMATLPFSWQECRLCGGAYLLWADPGAPLDTDETGLGERWTEWAHLDGRAYDEADSAACNTCERLDLESMAAPQRRWGVGLPGATITVMRARGLAVPSFGRVRSALSAPIQTGFAPMAPSGPSSHVPDVALRPARLIESNAPAIVRAGDPSVDTASSLPEVGATPSRASQLLMSLARSIATAPRSSVETYAPREPLEPSDPLVWIVIGTALVTLVAVVVGWFTSPGNVPR